MLATLCYYCSKAITNFEYAKKLENKKYIHRSCEVTNKHGTRKKNEERCRAKGEKNSGHKFS